MFSGAKGTLVKKSRVWSIAMMTITRPRIMSSEARRPALGKELVPAAAAVDGERSVEDPIVSLPTTKESIYGDSEPFFYYLCLDVWRQEMAGKSPGQFSQLLCSRKRRDMARSRKARPGRGVSPSAPGKGSSIVHTGNGLRSSRTACSDTCFWW